MLAHTMDVRMPTSFTTGCATIETGFTGGRFGKKGAGREVEGAPGTLEREQFAHVGLLIERDGARRTSPVVPSAMNRLL